MTTYKTDVLNEADLGGALRLSMEAGWNQTCEDWRRLLDLSPQGCLGVRVEGSLVATASVMVYGGDLAWVGMVLVDESFRGRGLGKLVFLSALKRAHVMGARIIGLDATEMGRPMYLKEGFRDVGLIERWTGRLAVTEPFPRCEGTVSSLTGDELESVLLLDRQACGCDRSQLLRRLFAEPEVRAWIWRKADDESPQGFAFVRPGREFKHLGPVVATGKAGFDGLLHHIGRTLPGTPVLADVLHGQELGSSLKPLGMNVQRQLIRKAQPWRPDLLAGPQVWLGAGFEWG